jgi:hypothetical protein
VDDNLDYAATASKRLFRMSVCPFLIGFPCSRQIDGHEKPKTPSNQPLKQLELPFSRAF